MSNLQSTGGSAGSSTRPYLIRALHDWCTDNGYTPYLAVFVDRSVQVPMEYVKNSEIVLNVSFDATSGLQLGNEYIEFRARFGGVPRDIVVPVDHVIAIYARENGQGMAFPMPGDTAAVDLAAGDGEPAPEAALRGDPPPGLKLAPASEERSPAASSEEAPTEPPTPPTGGRPSLKRVK
ncbi:ClpXP protease specificity-enhancing factor [Aquabacterium sp. A7-Y]|uniref:ClpXP protease specificity-enhancing factor n=1 Tax=Aquabacterium sp. A7-Y TaxID=1349605 RepID=UPI00223D2796|nr:ClpXP protease specificity-enhancing factor [Aquabacterium sp. A7-Y]MCW7537185.1 ClpXP protease specificity-enhancing factor [Aquabacterium sp. A7-Y]